MARINGRRENDSGGNTHYRLTGGRVITRPEGVRMVRKGKLSGYHVVRINDVSYLRDNPDKRESDNIDSQPLI